MNNTIFERLNIKWVLLIGFLVHLPMLRNGFTFYSDDTYVLNNILVHHINAETVGTLFTTYFDGHYHPLTLLSLAITYFFSGTHPLGYQLTNLAFHLFNCWLVYRILMQLEIKKNILVPATLIFAVHPLNVESVARITERKDTQYVLFLLLAVYFFIEFCKDEQRRKFYLLSLFCFVLSLLSKGQAVIFPLLLYVISWYRYKTSGKKVNHKFIAPLFILSIFFAYLNYRAQVVTGYLSETEAVTIGQVIAYPSVIICSYVFKLFIPFHLSAQYPVPEPGASFVICAVCILLMALGVFLLWKNKKYLALLGVLLYVASVFPMLRIVPISENFMPDRYNYLGLMGFGIFLSAVFAEQAEKYKRYNLRYLGIAWLIVISGICFKRTTIWKEGLLIWKDAYHRYPEDAFAARNYASFLVSGKRDADLALSLYRKSIELAPGDIMGRINYVQALASMGRPEEKRAAENELFNASPATSADMSNKAVMLYQYGRVEQSLPEFERAVALAPEYAKSRINIAAYYYGSFMFEQALTELDTVEGLHSNYIDLIYFMRTSIYINEDRPNLARKCLKKLRDLGADQKQLFALSQQVEMLDALVPDEALVGMSRLQKTEYAKSLYSKNLFFHGLKVFDALLKEEPASESLLSYAIACAYNLPRPDLVRKYALELKKNNYKVSDNTRNYLSGLGLSI